MSYHDWLHSPTPKMTREALHLHRRMKLLFEQSRHRLGSREMMKRIREEGIQIGRYRVRKLMQALGVKPRNARLIKSPPSASTVIVWPIIC